MRRPQPRRTQITVRVNERHLREGRRQIFTGCPLALALADAGVLCPSVGKTGFLAGKPWKKKWYRLTDEMRYFVDTVDHGRKPSPREFSLSIDPFVLEN